LYLPQTHAIVSFTKDVYKITSSHRNHGLCIHRFIEQQRKPHHNVHVVYATSFNQVGYIFDTLDGDMDLVSYLSSV